MRRRWPNDEEILEAVVALVDDGFCERRELMQSLGRFGERELRKGIGRSVRRGLLVERRAEGRSYFALSSEGWEFLRQIGDSRHSEANAT